VEYRPKTVQSLVGTVALERAYYHCRSCGTGTVPWDETLRLTRQALTPAAREAVCLAGAVDSFGEAADVVLEKLANLHVSESTVERTSEAIGQDIGRRLAAGETFGTSEPWPWHKDTEGKTCAYVSLDLTGLGMQGLHGATAEGRMAAVGMIYNPVPDDPACWARPRARRGSRRGTWPAWRAKRRWPSRCACRPVKWGWAGPSGGSPSRMPGPVSRTSCG
jgi:hypothetical protein